jgi:hypothetical protein
VINPHFVIIGALLQIIGVSSYLIDTIKGKTKPNRVSWLLWAVGPLIAFSAELDRGVGFISLMTFTVGFGPLLIFLGSFANRRSAWKLTKLDVACGVLSIGGLALWQITGSGSTAILFSILADFFAWVPTIAKSYRHPETENWHFFFFDATSAAITLLAIDKWNFAYWAWPVWIFASCTALAVVIRFKIGAAAHPLARVSKLIAGEDERPI